MTDMTAVVFNPQEAQRKAVVRRIAAPTLGAGQALVRVSHAALNRRDALIAAGEYLPTAPPSVMGSDGTGTVVETDEPDVCAIGTHVVINPVLDWGDEERIPDRRTIRTLGVPDDGTFAEYILLPSRNLCAVPAFLTPEEAAGLPLAGLTAYRALFPRGDLLPGETVLLTGIGGGVSMMALQMAVAHGARVFVTSRSAANIDAAVQLGASGGVETTDPNWSRELRSTMGPADLVIDTLGGDQFNALLALTREGGRIVNLGALMGNPKDFPVATIFYKQLDIRGTSVGSPQDFADLLAFVQQHQIRPPVAAAYRLEDFDEALDFLIGERPPGKVVLNVS